MKVFLALGSNLGDRREQLEAALTRLRALSARGHLRVSPVYENPALLPEGAERSWNQDFLNLACEIDVELAPLALLDAIKAIERELGRAPSPRWAPRSIDIDIVFYGRETFVHPRLTIPHPAWAKRAFVLDPLKDLAPTLRPPDENRTLLELAHAHREHAPALMGIANFTPDSFSDGGRLAPERWHEWLATGDAHAVAWVDVGAESTRPGAREVGWGEEWERLRAPLEIYRERYRGRALRPRLSVDTRHPECAQRALELGADAINDVSGLADERMLELLRGGTADYVLMHSLGVPVDPGVMLASVDPAGAVRDFLAAKLEILDRAGIARERVIVDPGIGFGKHSRDSIRLLREIERFAELGCRLLVGHSRKSFLGEFVSFGAASDRAGFSERDVESLGVSLALVGRPVDLLRVHRPDWHARAYKAFVHSRSSA